MKIVLSGTASLGFAFSKEEQLYDRCIMMHTTFIPYREFEEVLGIKGIDEYIRYGGTMSLSGVNYNKDAIFASARSAEEYIDTAIAKNIQYSLKMYEYGEHFRSLLDLYEKGELTNVINCVVENINHSFTRKVVERTFKSHDIAVTASNLLRDREEQSIQIEDHHMAQIEEYLTLLDLIMKIDLESLPKVNRKESVTVCKIYEVKYSKEQVPEQSRHLKDEEKCAMTSHRYGEITGKYVIYRGESGNLESIQYLNVKEYLKKIPANILN